MVKALSPNDHAAINEALKLAEHKTSAKISIVVHPASASYQGYILTYALLLGSAVSVVLWNFHIVRYFPWLLFIQLAIVAVCDLSHSLGTIFVRFVPRRTRVHFAHIEAMRVFHTLHAHVPPTEPFVLLFVSLAERYVHVVTNHVLHERLPDDWNTITDGFTRSIKRHNIRISCTDALEHLTDRLAVAFPASPPI